MKLTFRCIPLILFLFHSFLFSETANNYLFDSLSLKDGLSNSSVSSIQQDSKGFIWLGTQSGLNRYDGYEFIHYNHDIFNENSLAHGLVQSLYIDDEDIIWVGTYNGVSRLDPSTNKFSNYEYDIEDDSSISNNVVTAMVKDENGNLWVGTMGGLNRLDLKTGLFTRYLNAPDDPDSLMNDIVRTLVIDSENRLWLGNYKGLELYDEKTDSFRHFPYIEGQTQGLPSPYVMNITVESEDSLLIGTWDGGLSRFHIKTEIFDNYTFDDNRVYSLEIDKKGLIWVGTWGGGLFVFNAEDKSYIRLQKEDTENTSISSDTIYSLFRDNDDNMWVGTNGEGANLHNSQKKDYSFLSYNKNMENTIDTGKIETIMEDRKGNIWIGIYNGGINRYNPQTGEMIYYRYNMEDETSISNNIISDFLEDRSGNVWISTNEGLNIYSAENDSFRRIRLDPGEDLNATYTYTALYEDRTGNIWVGSHNNGLFKYNPQNGNIDHFSNSVENENSLSDNLVNAILERENGEFWIGTNKGLNLMDRESGTFRRYLLDRNNPEGLNNNAIRKMLEDSRNDFWIGTGGGGINRYDDTTGTFSHYTTREGLSNNFIMSLEEGPDNNIWAGSKYGVSIINTVSDSVKTLFVKDGLKASEFTSGSVTLSDNSVLLSSINEIYRFKTNENGYETTIPKLYIESVEVSDNTISDITPYSLSSDLILDYKDSNYLSFHYVALNYLNPENTTYAHKLEGFDDDWIQDDKRKYALYTNLQPGEYEFKVKASITDGVWQEIDQTQKILIKPPLWRTWWAYVLYTLLIVLFIYLLLLLRTNNIKIQKMAELERAESKYKHLNSYLSSILNAMPSILVGVNADLIITQWNGEAENDTGISEKSAKGKKLTAVYPRFGMDLKNIKNSLKTGEIISETKKISYKNNETRYEDITIYPINTDGKMGAVIRIDNVTKQVQMEEVLIQSEKMLSVGGLAAGMAHEINNPLAGMIQNAAVLNNRLWKNSENDPNIKAALRAETTMESIKKYMIDREIPQIIEKINESGRRISAIVDNMLSFAQKKDSLKLPHNITDLIDKTIDLAASDYDLKNQYDFKDFTLIKEFEDKMPPVPCESSKIQQVILNILRNGAEAMNESNTKNPQFIFRAYSNKAENRAIIEIENNGPTIDEEVRKRIFEPFYTTKPIGIGTGLGLSISYFIITKNHNGEIEVECNQGEGVRFIIQLPL